MDFDLFDEFDFENENSDACPGCNGFPEIDGITEGCTNEIGCGSFIREESNVDVNNNDIEEESDEEYQDEEFAELDFD